MTFKELSEKDRILRLARERGERGFTAVDFLAPHVVDGGKPITRTAARVLDLKREGFTFRSGGRRNRCKVYILDGASGESVSAGSEPSPPHGAGAERPQRPSESADTPAPLTLLDDYRPAPSCAIHGDDAA